MHSTVMSLMQAMTIEVSKIPRGTVNEFTQDFSNVHNAMWKVEDGYDEVDFTMNNKAMMAFYKPLESIIQPMI